MTDHDHALSGAYAVDALDADERARFEAHLTTCADCRAEVDSLREAAALLGADDVVAPPPSLRDDILAGIDRIRPLPPVTGTVTPLRRRHRLPLLMSAAAAVVLLLGVGLAWLRPWHDEQPARLTAAERILAAPDATRLEKSFPDGSRATVVLSRSEGKALIRTKAMALAPAGKAYELWLQTPAGVMEPAGLMPDQPDTTYVLKGDATDATGIGITVEPDGGSPQPTSAPIALFALDS
ncbi:anti-sigma factor [Nocardioides ginsengisoli]|uniref:Regulator of SigK n=1 Tax=Nocardioides ginsengisoli TaxID=363868 RepID=A0ABW3W5M4_9ACTN